MLLLSLLFWLDQFGMKIASVIELIGIPYTQVNLREALSSHNVEYRKIYLAALAATASLIGDSSMCQHFRRPPLHEEPVLADCVSVLLGVLEDQRCGSEFLSEALFTTGLLLSQRPDSRFGFFHISTQSCYRSLPSLTFF